MLKISTIHGNIDRNEVDVCGKVSAIFHGNSSFVCREPSSSAQGGWLVLIVPAKNG